MASTGKGLFPSRACWARFTDSSVTKEDIPSILMMAPIFPDLFFVPMSMASWPPAEQPDTAIFFLSIPYRLAFL